MALFNEREFDNAIAALSQLSAEMQANRISTMQFIKARKAVQKQFGLDDRSFNVLSQQSLQRQQTKSTSNVPEAGLALAEQLKSLTDPTQKAQATDSILETMGTSDETRTAAAHDIETKAAEDQAQRQNIVAQAETDKNKLMLERGLGPIPAPPSVPLPPRTTGFTPEDRQGMGSQLLPSPAHAAAGGVSGFNARFGGGAGPDQQEDLTTAVDDYTNAMLRDAAKQMNPEHYNPGMSIHGGVEGQGTDPGMPRPAPAHMYRLPTEDDVWTGPGAANPRAAAARGGGGGGGDAAVGGEQPADPGFLKGMGLSNARPGPEVQARRISNARASAAREAAATSQKKIEADKLRPKTDFEKWLPLIVGGFATAAGDSPFPMQNIAQGGLAGVKAYMGVETSRKKDQKDALARSAAGKSAALDERKVRAIEKGVKINEKKADAALIAATNGRVPAKVQNYKFHFARLVEHWKANNPNKKLTPPIVYQIRLQTLKETGMSDDIELKRYERLTKMVENDISGLTPEQAKIMEDYENKQIGRGNPITGGGPAPTDALVLGYDNKTKKLGYVNK